METATLKLELGGGTSSRGDGWVNVDLIEGADVRHDLNIVPWPFSDDSVDAVCSSHCFEHLDHWYYAFMELVRICKIGAPIEIRVPNPGSHMMLSPGHKYCLSPIELINNEKYFPEYTWTGPKRLRLDAIKYTPSILLDEAKRELPFLKDVADEAIMKFIYGTVHESHFHYTCVENTLAKKIVKRHNPWTGEQAVFADS